MVRACLRTVLLGAGLALHTAPAAAAVETSPAIWTAPLDHDALAEVAAKGLGAFTNLFAPGERGAPSPDLLAQLLAQAVASGMTFTAMSGGDDSAGLRDRRIMILPTGGDARMVLKQDDGRGNSARLEQFASVHWGPPSHPSEQSVGLIVQTATLEPGHGQGAVNVAVEFTLGNLR